MSISQNFPSIDPTLTLNFQGARRLDPRISFTRASTATYVGKDGLIKTAVADEARFDHDPATGESLGLLIEESRTNLQPYSIVSDGSQGWPTEQNVTFSVPTDIPAPDGSINDNRKMIATATNSFHSTFKLIISGSNGQIHTFSVYMKSAGSDYGFIYVDTINGRYGGVAVQFSTGNTAVMAANGIGTQVATSVVPVGNGWYRLSVSGSFSSTNNHYCHIDVGNDLAFSTFAGNGTDGIYVWGAQLEAGSFPTSYIPTSGSIVTRSADNASITGTNFTSWYNPTEGTAYIETILKNSNGAYGYPTYAFKSTTNSNYYYGFSRDNVAPFNYVNTSSTNAYLYGSLSSNSKYKTSLGIKENDINSYINGVQNYTTNSVTLFTPDVLYLGYNPASSLNNINGHIKVFTYYPERLTNAQLQTLTK